MFFSQHVLSTPAENLALEEAWLDLAEEGLWDAEILRLWQPSSTFVVIGRGSRIAEEVNLAETEAASVPVLRRSSGGAAIVAGPGCLMYAVLLSYQRRPHLRSLDQAHQEVMRTLITALQPLCEHITWQGTCDLVVPGIPEPQGTSRGCFDTRSRSETGEETGASALRLTEEAGGTGASALRLTEEAGGTGASALRLTEETELSGSVFGRLVGIVCGVAAIGCCIMGHCCYQWIYQPLIDSSCTRPGTRV